MGYDWYSCRGGTQDLEQPTPYSQRVLGSHCRALSRIGKFSLYFPDGTLLSLWPQLRHTVSLGTLTRIRSSP